MSGAGARARLAVAGVGGASLALTGVLLATVGGGPATWVVLALGLVVAMLAGAVVEARASASRDRLLGLDETQRLAAIGSWSFDAHSGAIHWSDELFRLFGRDPSRGTPTFAEFLDYVVEEDRPSVAATLDALGTSATPTGQEYRIHADDGVERVLYAIDKPDPARPGHHVGTVQDITALRGAERELERERRDLNAAQALARVGSWDYDAVNDRPGRWSHELWRMLALDPRPQAPSADEFLAMIHPADRPHVAAGLKRAGERDEAWAAEFRMIAADGRELVVAFRAEQISDATGRPVSVFGTIQDVTERAQREKEDRAVRELAQQVARGDGTGAVFEQVALHLLALFDAHSGAVVRFDAARHRGVFVKGLTADGHSLDGLELDLDGASAAAEVHRTERASRTHGAAVTGAGPELAGLLGPLADGVAAPIVVAGSQWGCLGITFADRHAPEDCERRLERFTELVAMAIANAEARDVLGRQASTDAITGLANHRSFSDRLREEATRARRNARELSLVLLDLDHFKDVNDSYGHQIGDRVLAEVGRRLGAQARDGELVARIGGEEFAWLLPDTGRDGARRGAERMRRVIEREPFAGVGTITVSAGVCTSAGDLDADELVRCADRALYWAKDSGRNAVVAYSEEAQELYGRDPRHLERVKTMASVRALARAIDSKDPSTREHSERVADLAEALARELGWTEKRARLLHACGLLHDIGKIGIPDDILLKPGRLSAEEYEQVKQHAELSARIAGEVLEDEQVRWIRAHHERWDGGGYPAGLAGESIPDGAQLLAVVDAYDVMTAARSYQAPKSVAEALAECRAEAGRQFAPEAVGALVAVIERAGLG